MQTRSSLWNIIMGLGLVCAGAAIGPGGIYLGEIDDAPGAALLGILLMIVLVFCGIKTMRRKA